MWKWFARRLPLASMSSVKSLSDATARKQPKNLALLDPQHIGVAGVIDVKVIPENQALSLHHPQHLGGYLVFHPGVENGGEDQGLTDQIKGRIRKGELCRIPAQDAFPKLSREGRGLPATLRRAMSDPWRS